MKRALFALLFVCLASAASAQDLPDAPATVGNASGVAYDATQSTVSDNTSNVQDAIDEVADRDLDEFESGVATDGQVPTADGLGGIAWEDDPIGRCANFVYSVSNPVPSDGFTNEIEVWAYEPGHRSFVLTFDDELVELDDPAGCWTRSTTELIWTYTCATNIEVVFTAEVDGTLATSGTADHAYSLFAFKDEANITTADVLTAGLFWFNQTTNSHQAPSSSFKQAVDANDTIGMVGTQTGTADFDIDVRNARFTAIQTSPACY